MLHCYWCRSSSQFFSFYLNEKKIEGKAKHYFKASLSNSIALTFFALIMVVVFKWGAVGRLSATLIGSLLFGIYGFKSLNIKLEINRVILLDALKFCWPISASALLTFFFTGVDKLMLERLNDSTTFGYYNVASQISLFAGFFGTALVQTFDPDIYKAIAANNVTKLLKIIILILVPCIILNLILIVFAEPLINILTFGRYLESTPYFRILTLRNITIPFAFVVSGIIVGYGYPRIDFLTRIFSAALSIFLFKILISTYGFYGASWGQGISMLFMILGSGVFIVYKKRFIILKHFRLYRS